MKLEDMKRDFPKTPDSIYQLIEEKVEEQFREESLISKEKVRKRKYFYFPKTAAAVFAATMLMGITGFAAVKLYQVYTEKNGTYGVQTVIKQGSQEESNVLPNTVPEVEIKTGYLPDRMIQKGDASKISIEYENAPAKGGISMMTVLLDAEQEQITAKDSSVVYSEAISFDGHDGVYLEKGVADKTEVVFDKKIYLVYPEVSRVLIMEIANNVTKEEALKVARQTELIDTGNTKDIQEFWKWSDYAAGEIEEVSEENLFANKVVSARMKLHSVGESFPVSGSCENAEKEYMMSEDVEAKVVSVEIFDDLSPLTKEYIPEEWKMAVDGDGKLVPNKLTYYKRGDGIDTLDEAVKTEISQQKLVYITLEYKNTGNEALKNFLYCGSLSAIRKDGDTYEMIEYGDYRGKEGWNYRTGTSVARLGDMPCFDTGGEEDKNYIAVLNPGESAVVHMAWIVNESDLSQLYLNLNTFGGTFFTEESLETGYVDIRP